MSNVRTTRKACAHFASGQNALQAPCEAAVPAPRSRQSGVALVIAIVGLLLVTAVAAGMILLETSETNVDANYREQQVALMAAKAGLQEARDRILSTNASPVTLPCDLPNGTPTGTCGKAGFAATSATYITAPGVTPAPGSSIFNVSTADSEFLGETGLGALPVYGTFNSSTTYSGPAANPIPYQWVRINLKTNGSAHTNNGTPYYVNATQPAANQVMYDAGAQTECVAGTPAPSPCATSSTLGPVYELTSFAVTRNGATAMVQDEVVALSFNLNLNSPLTIPGTVGSFSGGNSNNYQIVGIDGQGGAPAVPGCTANSAGGPAVAVSNGGSATTVQQGLPRPAHYTGNTCSYYSGNSGCIGNATLPDTMGTPAELEQTIQQIKQVAQSGNTCVGCSSPPGGNYTFSNILTAMGGSWSNSSDNPQVIYVNGNLDISSATGSGILVVTGNLNYNGASGWNGIVLVVGQGTTTYNVNGGGNGQFDGAVFVATTRDANGNILPSYGTSDFNINGGGGSGIFYNSCWINSVQQPVTYKLLSAKQIPN